FISAFRWKKQNKGRHLPLFAFFAVGVYVLITFGTSFVAAEVFYIIPWTLGWIDTINVLLTRTLFWAFDIHSLTSGISLRFPHGTWSCLKSSAASCSVTHWLERSSS